MLCKLKCYSKLFFFEKIKFEKYSEIQNNSPSEKELNQTNLNEIEDGEIPNDILNSSNKVISNLIN